MTDRSEFQWLLEQEIPRLRRYARSLTRDAEAADDLVQDCLEKAWRKRLMWSAHGSLRGWLFRILYRGFLNDRRRPGATEQLDDAALPPVPPDQAAWESCNDMDVALQELPREQRAVVTLVALEDMSYEEAARVLGVSIGTVRSRLSRGRDRLVDLRHEQARPAPLRRVK